MKPITTFFFFLFSMQVLAVEYAVSEVDMQLKQITPDIYYVEGFPGIATDNEGFTDLQLLHYGFASRRWIIEKYLDYKGYGQNGWGLERLPMLEVPTGETVSINLQMRERPGKTRA